MSCDMSQQLNNIRQNTQIATCRLSLLYCPVQALGCKNRPTPFPGWMSYHATKPGLVLFYILACFNCIVAY